MTQQTSQTPPGVPGPLPSFTFFGRSDDDPQSWADALRLNPDGFRPGQFEWWYTDGHLSNGMTFVASYHLEIDAEGVVRPYVTINLATPDGVVQDEKVRFDASEATFDREICHARVGPHFIRSHDGLKHYEIFVDPGANGGNGLHLHLERAVQSYAPGPDDGTEPPGPYFRWVCAVPSGTLRGTITIGGVEHEVIGSGYHDHNWGNVPMGVLVRDWHWARGSAGEYTAVAASVRFNNGMTLNNVFVASPAAVAIAEAGPGVGFRASGPVAQPDTGKRIEGEAHFSAGDETSGTVRFSGEKVMSSFIFDRDPQFNWWYTRFDAALEIEIRHGDDLVRRSGRAILEHMDFRGETRHGEGG